MVLIELTGGKPVTSTLCCTGISETYPSMQLISLCLEIILSQSQLSQSLHASAAISIPTAKFQLHLKPYWKPDNLKYYHNSMRSARKEWVLHGKPRNSDDVYYVKYKQAKRAFRKEHRHSKSKFQNSKFKDIYEAAEVDIQEYFRVTKRNKRSKEYVQVLNYNGESCDTREDICNLFGQYFNDLSQPYHDESFDVSFSEHVNDFVENIPSSRQDHSDNDKDENPLLLCPFKIDELVVSIKSLKSGKSPGPDGIFNEHVKRAGR